MTMLEKYGKSIGELKLSNIGKWNTSRGSDPLPYSNDAYQIDEPAISKLENEFGKTRYQLGQLGGGSANSPGYSPNKTWSDSTPRQ
jgi:hypothetical protein